MFYVKAEADQCTKNIMSTYMEPSKYSEDRIKFDKLFEELVAESTDDSDPKIAEAMKWLKRASSA